MPRAADGPSWKKMRLMKSYSEPIIQEIVSHIEIDMLHRAGGALLAGHSRKLQLDAAPRLCKLKSLVSWLIGYLNKKPYKKPYFYIDIFSFQSIVGL